MPLNVFFKRHAVKGKDIYVFDDVVTTGASYAIFANQLEMFGGHVLGGLFLGRTHYKYAK